jgi:hypothetical protein
MTRTSKALKRLGVAGLAAVTIGAGVPALVATSASAANATGVSISPKTATSAVNTCTAYTVTVTPAPTAPDSTTVDVLLSQTNPATGTGPANTPATLTFCDPDGQGAGTVPNKGTPTQNFSSGPGAQAPNAGTNVGGNSCTGIASSSSQDSVTRCEGQFVTTGGTATVTFGVASDTAGTVNVLSFFDTNSNRTPETFEPQDAATDTIQSGKATSLACTPATQSAPAGGNADYLCTATAGSVASTGSTVNYVITSGPDSNNSAVVTTRCGTVANPANNPINAGTTNNQGQVTCRVTNGGTLGTDQILFFVEQNNSAGPQTGEPSATASATFAGAGRNIACAPKDQTVQSASVSTVTCTVTDAKGNPVAPSTNTTNQPNNVTNNAGAPATFVTFSSTGAGRFVDGTTTKTVPIGTAGQAVIQTTSQVNEAGDQTVTANLSDNPNGNGTGVTLYTTGQECSNTSGVTQSGVTPAPGTPGNCKDTVTRHYTASGSPSASPTATASPTSSPTGSPAPGCSTAQQNLPVRVNTPIINATGLASVTVTGGTPNGQIELQGYSQNHYGTANFTNDPTPIDRTVTAGSDGSATISDLRPASNTRLRARVRGCTFGTNALGSVINVRTQLTLAAKRTGTRTVVISGGSIPARPGGLIVGIYRDGVLIGQARADQTSGQYSVTLHFPASDQGKRINLNARTGQDAQNAPGQSNTRSLLIT